MAFARNVSFLPKSTVSYAFIVKQIKYGTSRSTLVLSLAFSSF